MPQSVYTPEISERVYTLMRNNACAILKAGQSVILDAVFDRIADQESTDHLAEELAVPYKGVWLYVSPEVLKERLDARTNDASDATWDVTQQQIARAQNFKTNWVHLNANGTPPENLNQLRSSIHELHRKNCSKP